MARLTANAKALGAKGDIVTFRADFVPPDPLGYDRPRVEINIYNMDRWEHILETYGFHLSAIECIELIAAITAACDNWDKFERQNGSKHVRPRNQARGFAEQ